MNRMRLTRREVLKAMGSGALAVSFGSIAAACGLGSSTSTKSTGGAFNPMKYKGDTISVLWTVRPDSNPAFFDRVSEFTALTGIQVQADVIPEQQQRQKIVVSLNSKSPQPDVWQSSAALEKRLFSRAGWFEPLNKYFSDSSLVFPDWNRNDIGQGSWTTWSTGSGDILAIPFDGPAVTLAYRKDLFDAKGIKLTSLSDLQAAAQELHNPPNVYGFVARGLKNANVASFAPFLYNNGGAYLDKNGKLAMTSPEAVAALRMYAGLLKSYGPPGVVGYNFSEAQSLFFQGHAAMWVDGDNLMLAGEDPTKSKIVGNVGYAILPKGSGGSWAPAGVGGAAISAFSTKKPQAFLFAQWMMAKEQEIRALLNGAIVLRSSPWQDPQVTSSPKLAKGWVDMVQQVPKYIKPLLPELVDVTQFRDIFGTAITNAITGGDPAQLLQAATAQFQPIFDKDG